MYNRSDPRIRRTLNQISQNLEQANETAQVGLFSVHENYIKPCFATVSSSFEQCTARCLPAADDRIRRARARARLPPEYSFDFYDDWEEDEAAALLSADADEVEPEEDAVQPKRRTFMNYGSNLSPHSAPRRSVGSAPDPTVIPGPSYYGFFSGLPFIAGKRALRYQPSAENLQERPKGKSRRDLAGEGSDGDDEDEDDLSENAKMRPKRARSGTGASGRTEDSMSSRGDIFPSDEEDAVPLDDEFSMSFEGKGDDVGSARSKSSRRPPTSRKTSRSSKRHSQGSQISSADMSRSPHSLSDVDIARLADLHREERQAEVEEERLIEQRREAALRLAHERGLDATAAEETAAAKSPILGPHRAPVSAELTEDESERQSNG